MNFKPDLKPEIDFKDLIKKPYKLFGYSYIYFVVLLGGLGMLYIENLTVIGKNSIIPTVFKDSSAFVQDIALQSPRVIPPVDVMKVSVSTQESVQKGKELFKANCASCHGDNGDGNGPAAMTLTPKPRNFHALQGWTNGSKISEIYKTLQEGIVKNGMASYSHLSPADRFALIHYVRSFAGDQPIDAEQELQAMEAAYHLSKGSNTPAQVPVKVAQRIVAMESEAAVELVSELAKDIEHSSGDAGHDLLARLATNKQKALTALLRSDASSGTLEQFVRSISADPVQIGLRAEVVQLTTSQWSALFRYVTALRARKG